MLLNIMLKFTDMLYWKGDKKDTQAEQPYLSIKPTPTLPVLIKSLSPAMRVKLMNYVCTAGQQRHMPFGPLPISRLALATGY